MRCSQKGFTLIELATVLAIVGLLSFGVIKGASLIESTKINNLVKEFDEYESAVYMFTATHRRAPGYTQSSNSFSGSWDEALFWKDLRKDDLIDGDPSDGTSPVHVFGDPVKDVFRVSRKMGGIGIDAPFLLCAKNIKAEHAELIDQKLDDGNTALWSGTYYVLYGAGQPIVEFCKEFTVGRRG